jgi:uncharacterized protein
VRRTGAGFTAAAVVIAVAGCVGGQNSGDQPIGEPLVISGGGTTGIYYSYGAELAAVLSGRLGLASAVLETGGSIENLHNLADGTAQLAFSAADAASDAVAGRDPFDEPLDVLAVARVYDDFVHLVVPEDSPITTIDDLRGHAVSLGAVGSGTELIARRLLAAAGVDPADIDNPALGIDGSIEAMASGGIDAFFWSGGLPTPGVNDLAARVPIRLVDLRQLVETVRGAHSDAYRHGVVPKGMYGLPDDVATMAVPNFLMVRADAPDSVVHEIARILFDERSSIAAHVPAAALLDRPRAIFTEPVNLHPGALDYYRETKL